MPNHLGTRLPSSAARRRKSVKARHNQALIEDGRLLASFLPWFGGLLLMTGWMHILALQLGNSSRSLIESIQSPRDRAIASSPSFTPLSLDSLTNIGKYLVYITTLFSEDHQNIFKYCWPELMRKSTLLKGADIIIFSNNRTQVNETIISFVQQLYKDNPSFRFEFASEETLHDMLEPSRRIEWLNDDDSNQFQFGANEAVYLGFNKSWFADYSWVIRINPDVLIRNSTWLLNTMNDPTVDAILVECEPEPWRIHTDFFAVRPSACRPNAFDNMTEETGRDHIGNHEMTAAFEFKRIIDAKRHRWLPDNKPSYGFCRLRGPHSSVIHRHDFLRQDENGTTFCRKLAHFDVT